MMPNSPSRHALLQRCGAVILFVGICLAAFIYWSAPPPGSAQSVYEDAPLAREDSRRYAHDTEMNFGKVGALGDKARRTAAHLSEPKPLAVAIVVVAVLGAGGCLFASRDGTAGD